MSEITLRERIGDLLAEKHIKQSELSRVLEIKESTLSRFMTGVTQTLSHENITKIAQYFDVSADYLLGEVDEREKTNYSISELGLSGKAAANIYAGHFDVKTLNRLLEDEDFANLTWMIKVYMENRNTAGFAARNQLFDQLAQQTYGLPRSASMEIKAHKTPVGQFDLMNIQEKLNSMLVNWKSTEPMAPTAGTQLSDRMTKQILQKVQKGKAMRKPKVALDLIVDDVVNTIKGQANFSDAALNKFRKAVYELFTSANWKK